MHVERHSYARKKMSIYVLVFCRKMKGKLNITPCCLACRYIAPCGSDMYAAVRITPTCFGKKCQSMSNVVVFRE